MSRSLIFVVPVLPTLLYGNTLNGKKELCGVQAKEDYDSKQVQRQYEAFLLYHFREINHSSSCLKKV